MGRRSNDETSSFDMLLDTICNTFGGVVFIALMLAIFSQSEEVDDQSRRTTEQARLRRAELDGRQATVVASLSILQDAVPADSPAVVDISQAPSLAATNAFLREVARKLAQKQVDLEKSSKTLDEVVADILAETKIIERRAQDVTAETARLVMPPVTPRRLPRVQSITGYAQVFMIFQNGFLYVVNDVSLPLNRGGRTYDAHVVHVEQESGLTVLTPRVGKGQQVSPGCERTGALASLLRNANPQIECCYIYVDKRSFGAFNYVKQILVDAGFRYYWAHNAGPLALRETDELNAM